MSIQFRDIQSAPVPIKEKPARAPRKPTYDLKDIPVGGARAFAVGDREAKKVKSSIYQTAAKYRKDHPEFQFKVSIEENGTEIWVRRLDEGNSGTLAVETPIPAAQSNAETVSNGAYDYSSVAAE
jgi:hypothetical protein